METLNTALEDAKEIVNDNNASGIGVAQTKKCKCCGEIKDIHEFRIYGRGYKTICIACERKNSGITEEFAKYQDRDLINELRARGWKGELVHEQVIIKKLTL